MFGAAGIVLAGIVAVAFVSDVFDGVIARLAGSATDALRSADSIVDTIFYVAAVIALTLRSPAVISANAPGIAIVLGLEVIRQVIERKKYGRMAAYHMWSAKLWGITLLLGFLEAFTTGRPGLLFSIAVYVGILTDIEGLAASLVLSRWHHDVPTILHAIRLERAESPT
jgi:CDP-diacylglycerol--glycerol-3-phosphate 3-phosphatidyltransferase